MNRTAILTALLAGAALLPTAPAQAQDGCTTDPWMVGLRQATRTICDGPLNATTGEWQRCREITAPAFTTESYWISFAPGSGVIFPPREVPAFTASECYPVGPGTIPPGEPGHLA